MRRLVPVQPMVRIAIVMLLCVSPLAFAAEPATSTAVSTAVNTAAPRFTLKSSSTEAAPQQSGRYSLRARFAPLSSAGELREGEHFTLIGRFAKGGVSCGTSGLPFSDGFEGN